MATPGLSSSGPTVDLTDKVITDIHLEEISNSHCTAWKHLSPHLDLEKAVSSDVESSLGDESTKRHNFLLKWKRIKGSRATYKALITALQRIKCQEDAEYVQSLVEPPSILNASTQTSHKKGRISLFVATYYIATHQTKAVVLLEYFWGYYSISCKLSGSSNLKS